MKMKTTLLLAVRKAQVKELLHEVEKRRLLKEIKKFFCFDVAHAKKVQVWK
jgi:hypothetical protein